MSDKTLAERAAEYEIRRFDIKLCGAEAMPELGFTASWNRVITSHLKAYVAAESECDQLRNENERLRAALHRLGHEFGKDDRA